MLLTPHTTCWRKEKASRAALLIDMEAYFDAAMDAMSRAKHCVHLLNWAFEAETLFHPQPGCTGQDADRIGNFLIALAEESRPRRARAVLEIGDAGGGDPALLSVHGPQGLRRAPR